MKVLIVKTSSMGDIIHTLPALTDAGAAIPNIRFDWVVEESFAQIPSWHPLVDTIIPVKLRAWRKNIFSKATRDEWRAFKNKLQEKNYDLIIDAQGLFKSAFVSYFAKGPRGGLDKNSAREPLASMIYQQKYFVAKNQHAVTRVRQLFSQALNYSLTSAVPNYGIDKNIFIERAAEPYLVFLHGTTWDTKHWPENYWQELVQYAINSGYTVKLPWGNAVEKARAEKFSANHEKVVVLPRLDLSGVAKILAGAKAIVAVDTGLGHLAAAFNIPTISLYGPTNAKLTGALGQAQIHLQTPFVCSPCLSRKCTYRDEAINVDPPCFSTLPPKVVWARLSSILN